MTTSLARSAQARPGRSRPGFLARLCRPRAAARYGLIVGVDDYDPPVNKLHGAVNDAQDIATALRGGRRRPDDPADRQGGHPAEGAGGLGQPAGAEPRPTTLIFTYAGHGGQEPAAKGDHHPDGLAETFIMVNYDLSGPGLANRILDDR